MVIEVGGAGTYYGRSLSSWSGVIRGICIPLRLFFKDRTSFLRAAISSFWWPIWAWTRFAHSSQAPRTACEVFSWAQPGTVDVSCTITTAAMSRNCVSIRIRSVSQIDRTQSPTSIRLFGDATRVGGHPSEIWAIGQVPSRISLRRVFGFRNMRPARGTTHGSLLPAKGRRTEAGENRHARGPGAGAAHLSRGRKDPRNREPYNYTPFKQGGACRRAVP